MSEAAFRAGQDGTDALRDFAQYRFDCHDLPDQFIVVGLEGVEELNQPYRMTVHLRAEHTETDCFELLGRDVTVTITVRDQTRFFRGIVDRTTVEADPNLPQTCTLTIVPALSALRRTVDTRIFQDQNALDIVQTVLNEGFGPYKRSFNAGGVDAGRLVTRNYCVQYRESNFDFVHRLLEEEGIGYYFTHDQDAETLILFDDNRSLAALSTDNPIQFQVTSESSTHWGRMLWFPGTNRRMSTGYATRDYDWTLGSRGTLEAKGDVDGGDAQKPHEVYEHGTGRHHVIHEDNNILLGMAESVVTSVIGSSLPAPVADRVQDLKGSIFDRFSSSNTEDRARIRREGLQRDARVFEGVSCVTGLSAGSAFDLVGHPANGVDGGYYVTRITHYSSRPSGDGIGERVGTSDVNYHNRVRCLPRDVAWRPDWVTPKPRIDGVQTAAVVGPPGLEVFTDPHGRIKVKFPWDRAPTDLTGDCTCWIRVSQAWAGSTSPAFLFIPRVGMEVVVSFVDGDPDRPLVTGCVYNGDNATPTVLPVHATKSIIRTRTIPMGTGYNELSFEDALGFERVYIRAERDLAELVQRTHDVDIRHNEKIKIGGSQSEKIGGDQHIGIGGDVHRSVGGQLIESVGDDFRRSVSGVGRDRFGKGYHLKVDGGPMTTEVAQYGMRLTHGLVISQGDKNMIRISDDDNRENDKPGKGMTLKSDTARIHLTTDRIELKVGKSSLVVTPDQIQINGKTLPLEPGDQSGSSE